MAASNDRELKLVDAFDAAVSDMGEDAPASVGYQKVDALTVLERKLIPILTLPGHTDHIIAQVDVYDFNNYSMTRYALAFGNDNVAQPSRTVNFSDVEGKQCIRDAHRALVALGGSPPPLDEIMDFGVELKKSLTASRQLQLKPGQQQ